VSEEDANLSVTVEMPAKLAPDEEELETAVWTSPPPDGPTRRLFAMASDEKLSALVETYTVRAERLEESAVVEVVPNTRPSTRPPRNAQPPVGQRQRWALALLLLYVVRAVEHRAPTLREQGRAMMEAFDRALLRPGALSPPNLLALALWGLFCSAMTLVAAR
jgi:hypothetical protein